MNSGTAMSCVGGVLGLINITLSEDAPHIEPALDFVYTMYFWINGLLYTELRRTEKRHEHITNGKRAFNGSVIVGSACSCCVAILGIGATSVFYIPVGLGVEFVARRGERQNVGQSCLHHDHNPDSCGLLLCMLLSLLLWRLGRGCGGGCVFRESERKRKTV